MSNVDVVIELGREDAKIISINGWLEEVMNSSCAGWTGSFKYYDTSYTSVNQENRIKLMLANIKLK